MFDHDSAKLTPLRGRLLLIWLAVVLSMTLLPVGVTPGAEQILPSVCLICGDRGLADAILNLALFLPFGWLGGRRWGPGATALLAVGISGGIEVAQFVIPGRYATLGDVAFNTLWAIIGAGTVLRREVIVAALAPLGVIGASLPFVLFAPDPPDRLFYGQWTPELGHYARYEGTLMAATLAGMEVADGPSRESEALREAVRSGGQLAVTFVAARPPPRVAPIFSIYDDQQHEIVLLGADGADLVVHQRTRATSLRLDSPELRWTRALAGVSEGDTVDVSMAYRGGSTCLTLNRSTRCDIAPSVGSGWGALHSLGTIPPGLRRVIDGLWMIAMGGLLGLSRLRKSVRILLIMVVALTGCGLSMGSPHVSGWVAGTAMLIVGGGLGMLARRRRDRA